MMSDPTYNRTEIDAKYEWKMAFWLSELFNDNAPIGWGKYIPIAEEALRKAREASPASTD